MKYRIKETIDCNNVSTFKVQEKILWWWADDIQWRSKHEAENYIRFLQTKEVKYHTKGVKYHTVEQRAENNNIKEFEI